MLADERIRVGSNVDGSTAPLIPPTGAWTTRSCSSAGTVSTLPATGLPRTPAPETGHY
ncbi:hypothetical protein [Streptomyces stackebrandtii]|uniref:hypothetical protein n=1 Tax=Streptomyces stackebrandtii TaxID=3051177 RepID=UPI0028DBBB06|nr:hypothetical protein [Streptomyces sp. DSM 40976]